ncbi:CHAP domain-containing protein [Nocardioides marmoriginsengisoli]|uniref:CHAP domain-containing protein n=1 Tax=Nocardioides marmoriginsengisoli TaxID=661483 RepID=A0A3N0CJJ2_9ACTN|nr:CHAP domain-containing protein [Nocardioides marmoriginsengisoli]RNL63186.1 CHAP domain-containing protein [Nocardioides marmoriginsengisoli]
MATLLGLLLGLLVTAPSAQATSTLLCKGFTACAKAGYSSFGYGPTNYKKMWWRMYSGHNCTNYMAYRMIKAGMPETRPWSGSGDARNWGVVFKSKTNQTPTVGSVAWWSSNHVAYVEQVIDANTIIISEDHYRGDFDWRKIVRAGGGWPTGFIHLVDEAITATAPPTVVGTPQVDKKLTAKPGTWSKTGASYAYQWLAGGKAIAGATASSYVPSATQVGAAFTVKVTASKSGYRTGSSVSKATAATVPGTMDVAATPVISGIPKVGAVLAASAPTWAPAPSASKWAWFANGVYIPGGSKATLTLKPAQLGKAIRVVSVGSRPGYTDAQARSEATTAVGPEKLSVGKEPVLSGSPYVGRALSVKPGVTDPTDVTTTYQWFRDGKAIPGATAASYTPTLTDPGVRLSVQVRYSKLGYTPIDRVLKPRTAVRSLARIYVKSKAHRSVTVTVLANGVSPVRGDVVLTNRAGTKRTLPLVRGKVTFSPDWLYAGNRPLTVSYLGSYRVEARSLTKTFTIK